MQNEMQNVLLLDSSWRSVWCAMLYCTNTYYSDLDSNEIVSYNCSAHPHEGDCNRNAAMRYSCPTSDVNHLNNLNLSEGCVRCGAVTAASGTGTQHVKVSGVMRWTVLGGPRVDAKKGAVDQMPMRDW